MHKKKVIFILALSFVFLILLPLNLFAQTAEEEAQLAERMATLVFQIAIILFAARLGGYLFSRARLPSVLGEIIAGVIIGPYLLGAVSLPGFPHGLFQQYGNFPVSYELYSFATIASIVLLFLVGLETDIETFLRFSVDGAAIGIGGVVVSFILGDLVTVWFSQYVFGVHYGFADPIPLFLGVISTATSVGISARILSDKGKMDSPEGVTILSGAIVDDVLGIILLAVVIGLIKSGNVEWKQVGIISAKAILVWLGFMALGLIFSRKIGDCLKHFKDKNSIAVMSFALALLLAGIFEKSGLAMIIGAYIMGLTLSKTDLAYLIREKLSIFYQFFIPIFFCVMGMLVNVQAMFSGKIIIFALIYSAFAILAKFVGCSLPAFLLDFNRRGALRIGMGMVPRAEVALIIAGIGLSAGILDHKAFSVVISMAFITVLITPPFLSRMLEAKGPVMRKDKRIKAPKEHISYLMPNPETAELLLAKIFDAFKNEGFYIYRPNLREQFYQIRKEEMSITMNYSSREISFDCRAQDVPFIHTLFYEVLAELERAMKQLQALTDREKIGKQIFDKYLRISPKFNGKEKSQFSKMFVPGAMTVELKGDSKKEILSELMNLLVESGQLPPENYRKALAAFLERERDMSTGMQEGIAYPHARVDCVDRMISSVGVKKDGVDFGSLDKKPSRIFIATLIPQQTTEPYLKFTAVLSGFLINEENRDRILACQSNDELCRIFKKLV